MTIEDTRVIQVTNVSPTVTKDQLKTLFSYIGKVDEIKVYPESEAIDVSSRVCYIKFRDYEDVGVASHLTNTVFVDRALIVVPVLEGLIPDELVALGMGGSDGSNYVTKYQGLTQYPVLPASTEIAKVEEIRRTIYISNIDGSIQPETLMQFFTQAGEIKYMRMAGEENYYIKNACIEYTDQNAVVRALGLNGQILGGRQVNISPSNSAILKPVIPGITATSREIEEALRKVNEAESLISAASDPISNGKRSRSRRRSRSKRSRSRHSRSRHSRSRRSSRSSRIRSRSRRSRSHHRTKSRHRSTSKRSRSRKRRDSRSRSRERSKKHKSSRHSSKIPEVFSKSSVDEKLSEIKKSPITNDLISKSNDASSEQINTPSEYKHSIEKKTSSRKRKSHSREKHKSRSNSQSRKHKKSSRHDESSKRHSDPHRSSGSHKKPKESEGHHKDSSKRKSEKEKLILESELKKSSSKHNHSSSKSKHRSKDIKSSSKSSKSITDVPKISKEESQLKEILSNNKEQISHTEEDFFSHMELADENNSDSSKNHSDGEQNDDEDLYDNIDNIDKLDNSAIENEDMD